MSRVSSHFEDLSHIFFKGCFFLLSELELGTDCVSVATAQKMGHSNTKINGDESSQKIRNHQTKHIVLVTISQKTNPTQIPAPNEMVKRGTYKHLMEEWIEYAWRSSIHIQSTESGVNHLPKQQETSNHQQSSLSSPLVYTP